MVVTQPDKVFWPFVFTLDIPERPRDLSERYHNKYAKDALRGSLENYQDTFVPKKFQKGNVQRYDYKPRSRQYSRRKRRIFKRPPVAMVFAGRARSAMTRIFRIRIGGTAAGGTLRGRLILQFPFAKSGRFRRGGTRRQQQRRAVVRQLITEMERFAADETPKLAEWWAKIYFDLVEKHRERRKRVRIS